MKEGFIPTEVELTVWSSMLDGEFTVKVIWSAPYRGELTIADEATVLQREPVSLAYPGEDGKVHELTLKTGDLIVTNGTFHSWHNRSTKPSTILFVVLAAERKAS